MKVEKLRAETRKILRESGVVPFAAGAAVMVAATALMGVVLKFFMH